VPSNIVMPRDGSLLKRSEFTVLRLSACACALRVMPVLQTVEKRRSAHTHHRHDAHSPVAKTAHMIHT
jgi:hypothetical protein